MDDPFTRHGITHLSPSSLALYRASPALWCLRYLYRIKDEVGPFALRGRAVEAAVDAIIMEGASDDQAIERARYRFELNARGELNSELNKERNALPNFVRQAALTFRRLGQPIYRQRRIEVWIDGIEVPLIGYCDYVYQDFVVDLKSTFALPSKPRVDDAVQVVMYADALGYSSHLVYVSPRMVARYGNDGIDVEGARRILRQSARAVRAMLLAAPTREAAAEMFVPVVDDFRWSTTTRSAAQGVWS